MKIRFLFLIFALLLPGMSQADLQLVQLLEDLNNNTPLGKEQMTWSVSGKRVRLDKGQNMSSIILMDRKTTFSIMHEPRAYVKLSHDSIGGALPLPPASNSSEDLQVETTNQKETISGYVCRMTRIKEKNGDVTELWMAENAPSMKTFMEEFKSFMDFEVIPSMKEIEKHPELGGLPIRAVEYRGDKPSRRVTIQRLTVGKLEDSLFEIPAGYEEWKMSDFAAPAPAKKK